MKTFIYTTQAKRIARSGSSAVTAQVFEVKNNVPEPICQVQWNTGSFKGETSAIMNHLAKIKKLPIEFEQGYYRLNEVFQIIGLQTIHKNHLT